MDNVGRFHFILFRSACKVQAAPQSMESSTDFQDICGMPRQCGRKAGTLSKKQMEFFRNDASLQNM